MSRTAVEEHLGSALEDEPGEGLYDDGDAAGLSPADADDEWEPIDADSGTEADIDDDIE